MPAVVPGHPGHATTSAGVLCFSSFVRSVLENSTILKSRMIAFRGGDSFPNPGMVGNSNTSASFGSESRKLHYRNTTPEEMDEQF